MSVIESVIQDCQQIMLSVTNYQLHALADNPRQLRHFLLTRMRDAIVVNEHRTWRRILNSDGE